MARVVCQVLVRADRLTLLWSEGPASFPPYTLEGHAFTELAHLADQAREQLAKLGAAANDPTRSNQVAQQLAPLGYALYRAIFQLDLPTDAPGQAVCHWLDALTAQGAVEQLEIIGDVLTVPWNTLYDLPPDPGAFSRPAPDSEGWRGFWGQRYPLTAGRRVQWWRGRQLPSQPAAVLALDPGVRSTLPPEESERLTQWIAAQAPPVAESREALTALFESQTVDVIYVLGRAEPGGIRLGNDLLTPDALASILALGPEEQDQGHSGQALVILNPCHGGTGGKSPRLAWESFVKPPEQRAGFLAASATAGSAPYTANQAAGSSFLQAARR